MSKHGNGSLAHCVIALVLIGGCSSLRPTPIDASPLSFWHLTDRVMMDVRAFQGKVVIVNFWATWCGPCLPEMPALEAVQREHPVDLALIFLSDEPADLLRAYIADGNFQATHGRFIPDDIVDPYRMARLRRPMTFIIDRDGVLQEVIQGARSRSFFEQVLEAYY